MIILLPDALVCAEATCSAVISAREYPRHRCPVCGSECLSMAAEEAKRAARESKERVAA